MASSIKKYTYTSGRSVIINGRDFFRIRTVDLMLVLDWKKFLKGFEKILN